MITAEPSASNTDVGWPLTSEIAGLATSTASSPLGGTCRLGMSPAWGPSVAAMPCFALPGLKCPPALVKGGSHLPTAWTWKACSPAGMPFTDSLSSTPCGVWTRSTVPTSLPLLSLRTAFAVSAWAETAAVQAMPSTAINRLKRIVPSSLTPSAGCSDGAGPRRSAGRRLHDDALRGVHRVGRRDNGLHCPQAEQAGSGIGVQQTHATAYTGRHSIGRFIHDIRHRLHGHPAQRLAAPARFLAWRGRQRHQERAHRGPDRPGAGPG